MFFFQIIIRMKKIQRHSVCDTKFNTKNLLQIVRSEAMCRMSRQQHNVDKHNLVWRVVSN